MDGDLISRKALKSELKKREWEFCFPLIEIDEVIDEMPAVDAEPVRHGHWINRGYVCGEYKWECSVCGESEWRGSTIGLYYCPNCGAKMEGVEK